MSSSLLNTVLPDLLEDLSNPGLIWQIAALAISLGLGWLLARIARNAYASRRIHSRAVRIGFDGFSGALAPLFGLVFVILAKQLLAPWRHVNLLRLAIPLLASFVLIRCAFYIMRRIFARRGTVGKSLLLFEKVFATLVWFGFALYITGIWQEVAEYLQQTQLPFGRNKVSLFTILQAAVSVLLTLVAALWIGTALEERLMQVDTLHTSLRVVFSRMIRAVLILVAVLLSLSLVGIDLTVLSVFGGALGVGLGLGLQKVASNYVSGFVILLDRSLSIGDLITVDKFTGKVARINTRYTILQGQDGVDTVVPNAMLLSSPVQNFSLTNTNIRLSTRITVGYDTDLDQVLKLLEQTASAVEKVLTEPAPQALLVKFLDDGFELELGFWVGDSIGGRQPTLSNVNRAIWHALREADVVVPYPQREIRIVDNRTIEDMRR